ncbi:MAG: DEAD/DEAH box helicase [Gammaproteobacteria bacterium]|nr:DEAD/DEAH box helicase [Gammaproteobacteria bacterium]
MWSGFLAHLEYLVLDELHMYRGVFGSHTAQVLRRLLRLCEQYGSRPSIIACSATIGNPGDLARQLTGRECEVVDDNGAPAGARHVVVWNPPVTNAEIGARRSGNIEATFLLRSW